MPDYWLDTNIFIESKNGAYAFDIAPGFWEQLANHASEGHIGIPSIVFEELVAQHDDELSAWISRFRSAFSVEPDATIQAEYRSVADRIAGIYETRRVLEFLGKADSWLVAYARASGGAVATLEQKDLSDRWQRRRIKIPNVCADLGVPCIDRNELVRRLGISLR